MRCVPLSDTVFPKLLKSDWVAPNATVIGDVEVGEGSSLWFGTVVRGDSASVKIGKNTILMDWVHVESSKKDPNQTIRIGDSVFVGSNAWIFDAQVESFSFIGPNATVHSGAVVEGFSVVAGGS